MTGKPSQKFTDEEREAFIAGTIEAPEGGGDAAFQDNEGNSSLVGAEPDAFKQDALFEVPELSMQTAARIATVERAERLALKNRQALAREGKYLRDNGTIGYLDQLGNDAEIEAELAKIGLTLNDIDGLPPFILEIEDPEDDVIALEDDRDDLSLVGFLPSPHEQENAEHTLHVNQVTLVSVDEDDEDDVVAPALGANPTIEPEHDEEEDWEDEDTEETEITVLRRELAGTPAPAEEWGDDEKTDVTDPNATKKITEKTVVTARSFEDPAPKVGLLTRMGRWVKKNPIKTGLAAMALAGATWFGAQKAQGENPEAEIAAAVDQTLDNTKGWASWLSDKLGSGAEHTSDGGAPEVTADANTSDAGASAPAPSTTPENTVTPTTPEAAAPSGGTPSEAIAAGFAHLDADQQAVSSAAAIQAAIQAGIGNVDVNALGLNMDSEAAYDVARGHMETWGGWSEVLKVGDAAGADTLTELYEAVSSEPAWGADGKVVADKMLRNLATIDNSLVVDAGSQSSHMDAISGSVDTVIADELATPSEAPSSDDWTPASVSSTASLDLYGDMEPTSFVATVDMDEIPGVAATIEVATTYDVDRDGLLDETPGLMSFYDNTDLPTEDNVYDPNSYKKHLVSNAELGIADAADVPEAPAFVMPAKAVQQERPAQSIFSMAAQPKKTGIRGFFSRVLGIA